jgi:diamine N-acetyltransferase
MNLDSFTIRRASAEDAEILASLGELAFTQAFAAQNNPHDFAAYLAGAFSAAIQAAELAAPGSVFFVIEKEAQPAGYARLQGGATRACVSGSRPVELVRFYVLEEWKGKGVAHKLMQACLEEAGRGGFDVIWLSAWKENPRALAFYRKWGFAEVGTGVFVVGAEVQEDAIMSKQIAS